ncbi:unnamed protein product [Rotaria sp. Silwood2]|nr:unnamed protein product [Rotaria sp. Silwood2]CAF3367341.1 unnamed protein product [Rotaria sp. Silwood2]CAF4287067.1 unnamed protein product [Rotaria sp. Silwood2]CAF4287929.1 unnamed protein product [Rotaria sp. Silwood2]
MHPSRDPSPRPRLLPGTPQQQQRREHDNLQYETFDLNYMMNKNQHYHREVNEKHQHSDYHQQMNPLNRINNNNIRPLMEYNNPNESPSDIEVNTSTTNRLNKKRKQSTTDEPMEHNYDESPICQQVRDINVYSPQLHTTKSTSINASKSITEEAKRFAQSRYPYPPFILLFKSSKINDKMIINELINYCKENYSFDLDLAGFRISSNRCNTNKCNLLIFVKNSLSFSFPLTGIKWPEAFGGEAFKIERQPVIPPQLSVIISNVSYRTNMLEFEKDLKTSYDNIVKVVRLKNKNQSDTKFVKLEFNSPKVRDEILAKGYMMINYLKYEFREYLPQAFILICSNYLVNHQCQGVVKYLHCGGAHYSNDLKCKVIKQFRADLTSSLLSLTSKSNSLFNRQLDSITEFPPLPPPQIRKQSIDEHHMPLNAQNGIMIKLDRILNSINHFEHVIGNLTKPTEAIEEWTDNKKKNDSEKENEIKALQRGNVRVEGELRHQMQVIEKIFLPVLDDIFMILTELNIKDGGTLNADFNSKSGLWKNEIKAYLDKRLKTVMVLSPDAVPFLCTQKVSTL